MIRRVKEKVVFITGASSGIGRATAALLGRKGARVILVARRSEKLEEIANEITASGGEALVCPADVTRTNEVERAVNAAIKKFGHVDVLINNAGAGLAVPVKELSEDQLRRLWELNFMGMFHCTKLLLPHFLQRNSGHIINIASAAALRALPLYGAYCATKSAMAAFSDSLRSELLGTGVKVTVVYPFITRTEFYEVVEKTSGGRGRVTGLAQSPEWVARVILWCIKRRPSQAFTIPGIKTAAALNHFFPGLFDRVARLVIGDI